MTRFQAFLKRSFDIIVSAVGLLFLWPAIVISILLARADTKASGLFHQQRIGLGGKPFTVHKIRTMRAIAGTSITAANDARITPLGAKFRRYKIDELPQLWNVLVGEMSFVGPRPDVAGYTDKLSGEDREIWNLRPGITGPATLKYRNEEDILAEQDDPVCYNDTVIWPDKVAINLDYYRHYSLRNDIRYLLQTVTGQ